MTGFQNFLFEVPGLLVRRLSLQDWDSLKALLEKSADYIMLVTGAPPDDSPELWCKVF